VTRRKRNKPRRRRDAEKNKNKPLRHKGTEKNKEEENHIYSLCHRGFVVKKKGEPRRRRNAEEEQKIYFINLFASQRLSGGKNKPQRK
jgi:hypothetical protein